MADLALVTTRNEERSIESLVVALRAQGLDVLVIDAGSDDDTVIAARHGGAVVRALPGASGPAALMAGWRMMLSVSEYRALVQIDAGGSHDPTDVLGLLRGLAAADVVVGSRFLPGSHYTGRRWRRVASRALALACNARTGASISDWSSGYRAFNCKALTELATGDYRASMHGWQIEVLGRALARGLRVVQAPISYRAVRSSFDAHVAREAGAAWIRL